MSKQYDIREAAIAMSFSESYVRTLVRRGTLETTRVPLSEGSLVTKHMISEEEIDRFMNEAPHKSRRHDSRNKFIMYATPDEIVGVLQSLRNSELGEVANLIEPANDLAYWPVEGAEDG